MVLGIFWLLAFCVTNTISIVLLGDRALISGNLLNVENVIRLILNWKFILAMSFAVATAFFGEEGLFFAGHSLLKWMDRGASIDVWPLSLGPMPGAGYLAALVDTTSGTPSA
ncbi:MAG: hypothetical protein EOP48_10420, partial [Sphingobacteriales bacterium]